MQVTVGRKTIDSLGAKLDQLHGKLNEQEKLLLNSLLSGGGGTATEGKPSAQLRNLTGKVQLASSLVIQ